MAPGGGEVLGVGRRMTARVPGKARSLLKDLWITTVVSLPVFAVIMVVAFFFCRIQLRTGRDIILNNELKNTALETGILERSFVNAVEDILYISRIGDLINLRGEPLSTGNVERIGPIYRSFLAPKLVYENIRILDSMGKELVRVEYNDGSPRIATPGELGDKSGRYYFQSARGLKEGDIYISPLDRTSGRNGERGIPVIRLATPVFSRDVLFGIVALDLRGTNILEAIAEARNYSYGELILANEESFWLVSGGDDPSWEFLREEEMLGKLPEGVSETIEDLGEGFRYSEGNLTVVRTVYPLVTAEREYRQRGVEADFSSTFEGYRYMIKLVSFVPEDVFRARNRPLRTRTLITASAIAVFGFFLIFLLLRMRSKRIAAEENVLDQAGIFRLNPAPVIKTDRSGRIVNTNPAAVRTISEDLLGRPVEDILHGYGEAEKDDLLRHGYTQFEDSRLGRTHLYTGIMG
ncbi:MAG: PAS domain-containing protein, partial [Spirochaetota bacterium]